MGKVLSKQAIEEFHKKGYHLPIQAVSREAAVEMRGQLEAYEKSAGGVLHGARRYKSHLLFKWLSDLIRTPTILDAVEDLIGPDILVWSTDWWIKEAHSPQFVSWHQDSQYWGLDTLSLIHI